MIYIKVVAINAIYNFTVDNIFISFDFHILIFFK